MAETIAPLKIGTKTLTLALSRPTGEGIAPNASD